MALLKAGQGGSGGDLGVFLVEVFGKGEVGVEAESKGWFLWFSVFGWWWRWRWWVTLGGGDEWEG